MAIYTDIAAEIWPPSKGAVPAGVFTHTASAAGVNLTRVDVRRTGLRRPRGSYITLDMPAFARIDERNESYVWAIASQLRALLPKQGLVLVAGVGNRAVTADALGPETADRVFVTRNLCRQGEKRSARAEDAAGAAGGDEIALRPVAAFAPGVEGATGLATAELLRSLVNNLKPAALVAVDSLCTSDVRRLGCSVQISTAGLWPRGAQPLTAARLGVPVVAVGVPTVMEAGDALHTRRPLVVTPKDIDAIIRRGATLLALAINKALQPALSVGELSFLTS